MEERLQTAEGLLRRLVPNIDLRKADPTSPLGRERSRPETGCDDNPESDGGGGAAPESGSAEARFISLVEKVGQLDLNDDGEWDFHGVSSGAVYFSRIIEHFPELLGHDFRTPFLPQAPRPLLALPLGAPGPSTNPGWRANPSYYELPPRDLARTLCEYSFNCASCVLRTVHIPSFYQKFERLYDTATPLQKSEDRRFLGLLFSVLALGSMYDVDENDPSNPDHYAVAMNHG